MAKMKESKLVAESRDVAGSAASRRLRRDGRVPGVINNEKGEAQWIRLNRHDFELMLHRHVSENLILDLAVDGKTEKKVLLKEVQHDPLTGHVLHADFVEISMTRKMRIGISIKLIGEPLGVSQQGGILEQSLRTLEVECLPTDLMEEIEVDVSALEIGSSLLVRDLKIDPKLTVLTPEDLAVASVTAPRAEEVPVAEAAVEGAVPGEPELVGERGKKEEGEEAAEAAGAKKPAAKEKE